MSTERTSFPQRLADFLVERRLSILVVTILLAVLAIFPAKRVQMDRSISSMFSQENPLMPPFRKLERVFEGNESVLAVYRDPQLFDPSGVGFQRLKKIADRLAAVDGVKGVLSIEMLIGDRLGQDAQIPKQVKAVFQGYTHGGDDETTSVICILEPKCETEVPRAYTIAALRQEMGQLPDGLEAGTVAGEPVMIEDAFRYVDQDGDRLFTITTLLLSIVILACFRSFRWVIVPIAVVQLALLFTNASLGIFRLQLSMVSSMLTAVVTVIGVATVVHVIVRFREYRQSGSDSVTAMHETARVLAAPVFWACITDAVGFGALMYADVGPVRDFGMMMALGSLMVLLSVALLVPGLALFGRKAADPQQAWGEETLDTNLLGIVGLVYKRPWTVGTVALALSLVAVYGITWLEIETDFTKNFRRSTPIVKSYELVESKLGGAGVLDIIVPAPEHLTWDYMRKVLVMENELRQKVVVIDEDGNEQPGINRALSLADAIVSFSPRHPDRIRWRRGRNSVVTSGLKTIERKIPHIFNALFNVDPACEPAAGQAILASADETNGPLVATAGAQTDDGTSKEATEAAVASAPSQHAFRIMLRAKERQPSEQKKAIITQVMTVTDKHFPDAEVTGYFALLTGLIDSILRDQWKTFGVALLGIFLTMTIAFRSIRFALIATFPNALPILVVSGLMGWLGLKVNMGGAMIAAVSMGLSIDSSIHYLMAYKRARQAGKSLGGALTEVQQTVGRAMVFSTLALIVGFAALATSQFIPTVYFGVLVSLSMLGALFGNLVWLPLLLRVFQPATGFAAKSPMITAAVQKG